MANEVAKAVQRRRKFNPVTLAQTLILALIKNPKASSEQIASMASSLGIQISPQAIDHRYSAALCNFFEALLPRLVAFWVDRKETLAPLLDRFSEVRIIDSSSIKLPECMADRFPSSGGAAHCGHSVVKFQTEFELKSGTIQHLQAEPGRSNDQGTSRQLVTPLKGSLRIADLGYFTIAVLGHIAAAGAYFLTRIPHNSTIYVDGQQWSLVPWLERQVGNVVDCMIELGAEHRQECRLIASRVPPEIANQRRNKLYKNGREKGWTPTQAALKACDWEFLVTNLPTDKLSVKEAIVLYRARWQIELLFKRWKSISRVTLMDGKNDITKICRFWIRMCGVVVQNWLVAGIGWSATLTLTL